jgi:hypothetical protein
METPVLYVHAPQELEVDVDVAFPRGLLSEWFPQVSSFGPVFGIDTLLPENPKSHLRWNRVRILSAAASRQLPVVDSLPVEPRPSHYYPRPPDASQPGGDHPAIRPGRTGVQRDRLLFYRGAGNFPAPLRVGLPGNDRTLRLENHGTEPIGPLFAVHVREGRSAFTALSPLAAGASLATPVPEPSGEDDAEGLGSALREALTAAGLDREEAEAMVNTWRDSWFAENGVRVLYLLPEPWTDRTPAARTHPASAPARARHGRPRGGLHAWLGGPRRRQHRPVPGG